MKILRFPDNLLRRKASVVGKIGADEKRILAEMAETMYISKGVGLAATQVGVDKRIAVIDVGEGLLNIINPVIVKAIGSEIEEEGCLSVPDTIVKVKRAKTVAVNFMDEAGQARQLKASGLLARAIQHEIDHMEGRLIIDYLSPIKKILIKTKGLKARNI